MSLRNSTLSILLLALAMWAIRFYFLDLVPPSSFESHIGEKVKFAGIVTDAPRIRNTNTRFLVRVEIEKEFNILSRMILFCEIITFSFYF